MSLANSEAEIGKGDGPRNIELDRFDAEIGEKYSFEDGDTIDHENEVTLIFV